MPRVPHLLLAAGASSRMGQQKALLPWGPSSVIVSRIETLQQTQQPIIVVLGAEAASLKEEINGLDCHVCYNQDWPKGMGGSISTGLSFLMDSFPEADGVLISLVDQPLIPPTHFQEMIHTFQENKSKIIVSQSDAGWSGVPVLFGKKYFSELHLLEGTNKGKTLIAAHSKHVTAVNGHQYLLDMDTPEAYEALLRRTHLGN